MPLADIMRKYHTRFARGVRRRPRTSGEAPSWRLRVILGYMRYRMTYVHSALREIRRAHVSLQIPGLFQVTGAHVSGTSVPIDTISRMVAIWVTASVVLI